MNYSEVNVLLDRGLLMSLLLERQKGNSELTETVESVVSRYHRIIYEAPGASALEHFLHSVDAFREKLVAISKGSQLEVGTEEAESLRETIRKAGQSLRIIHAFQVFAKDVGAVGRNLEDTIAYLIRLLLIARQSDADVFLWPQRWNIMRALFEEANISLKCTTPDQRWQVYEAEGFPYLVAEDAVVERTHCRFIIIDRALRSSDGKKPQDSAEAPTEDDRKTRKKRHVFISYCHENQEEVREIRRYLSDHDEATWWDQDILPGQDWKFEIRRAMKDSYAVLLCLSKESEARPRSGIYPEIFDAINLYREYAPGNVFIIPVRLSECEIPMIEIDGSRTLDRLQFLDLFPTEKKSEGLKRALAALRNAQAYP